MKQEIKEKVSNTLQESDLEALLVFGADNVQYLSGAHLHYPVAYPDRYIAIFWPKEGDPVCILPVEWETSFLNLSWITKTRGYVEKPGSPSAITEVVTHLVNTTVRKTGGIGVDTNRIPLNLYNRLEGSLEEYHLESCDTLLKDLRIIKTPKELELLTEVAKRTDHTIAGQAHHVLVVQASTEMSNTENIRVHALERELDEVGHHAIAQATSGPNSAKFWPNAPMYGIGFDRVPKHHDMMRMELVGTLNGYWSNGARMLTMGEITAEQKAAYQGLVAVREAAVAAIKPGLKCSELYQTLRAAADEKGIELLNRMALGHGVGVTNFEPPYISRGDDTELQSGMVIVLNPIVPGPAGELMMGKDTVIVTEEGCRIVGWYKDWREPFISNYTY